jgi:hypothetical protein
VLVSSSRPEPEATVGTPVFTARPFGHERDFLRRCGRHCERAWAGRRRTAPRPAPRFRRRCSRRRAGEGRPPAWGARAPPTGSCAPPWSAAAARVREEECTHMLIYSHQGSARMAAALPHVTCNGGLSTAILHFIVLPNSPSSTLRELPCMSLARCYATSCTSLWAVSGGKRRACGAVQGDSRSQKRCAQGVQHLRFCRAHAGRTNVAWC